MSNEALGASSVQILDSPASSIRDTDSCSSQDSQQITLEVPRPDGITMSSNTTSISVAVDPVALITTECITITSAMRKHARWAHSSVSAILGGSSSPLNPNPQTSRPSTPRDELATRKGHRGRPSGFDEDDGGLANRWGLRGKKGKSMQDNPLMAGFGRLRRELVGCKGSSGAPLIHTQELTSMKIYTLSIRHHYYTRSSKLYRLLRPLPLLHP
jgi:brefeldin A-resistance guanine nucleotide exchange factor 1